MGYLLENAEATYRPNWQTWFIPRLEQRTRMQVGECVTLGFIAESESESENGTQPERVWVRIDLVREGGRYIGVLLSNPATIPNLAAGNRIEFAAENISEIYVDEGDYRWFDDSKLAMVSALMFEGDTWPGRLMRIPPAQAEHSGWLLLRGDESPQFMRDWDNFHSLALAECVGKVPVLRTILYENIGADYKWDAENLEYRANR